MFRSQRLPSPGCPEEALAEAWCSAPASRPPPPPRPHSPALFTEAMGGERGQSSCVWTGAHSHSQSRGTHRDTGPPPPGGGDGVCCCRTWGDRVGPWEAASDSGVCSGRRFFPPNQAGDSGAQGEGTGMAAEGAGTLPGVTGRSGGSCPGVQAELSLIPSGGVWMLSLGGASQANVACVTLFPGALPRGRGPAPPQGPGALSGTGLGRMGPMSPTAFTLGPLGKADGHGRPQSQVAFGSEHIRLTCAEPPTPPESHRAQCLPGPMSCRTAEAWAWLAPGLQGMPRCCWGQVRCLGGEPSSQPLHLGRAWEAAIPSS